MADRNLRRELPVAPELTPTRRKIRHKKSYPGEAIFQKRYRWWLDHKFGDEAARWAARYRLGEPRKRGILSDREDRSAEDAIKVAKRRPSMVAYRMRRYGETEKEAIAFWDRKLRLQDLESKVDKGLVPEGYSLSGRKVESNIFKDVSP
jgi:hypothetical protein